MARLRKEEEALRLKLYQAGLTDRQIAERCGTESETIYSWRQRHGLVKKSRIINKKKCPPTLCWMCENTNAEKCSWFDPQRQRPVEGWTAEKTAIAFGTPQGIKSFVSYCVISCPNYKPCNNKNKR